MSANENWSVIGRLRVEEPWVSNPESDSRAWNGTSAASLHPKVVEGNTFRKAMEQITCG